APEALAARLNQIEPSAAASATVDRVLDPVAPSADVKPVSLPPPDRALETLDRESRRQVDPTPSSRKASAVPQASAPEAATSNVQTAPKLEASPGRPLTRVVDAAPDPSLPTSLKSIEEKALAGVAEAQHDLAAVYTAGHGGAPQNYEKAAFWFGKAAGQGVANARYNLGVLYQQGLGVPKDMREAIKWYRAAADLGHPEARYNLGIACIEGVGVPYDPRKAAEYFESAAAGGVTEAAYNLGLIYENGLLGKPAPEEALLWYKKAADKGSADARAALAQLSKSLHVAPEDLERVINRAQTDALLNAAETGVEPPPVSATPRAGTAVKAKAARQIPTRVVDPPVPPPPVGSDLDGQAVGAGQTAALDGSLDRVIISQIQDQLKDMGMYNGPSDGALGPMTADAIRSYQVRNDLPVDGQPNESLLIHMLAREIRD
ncbi:MAG TPA: SEL1-like repeat protein, partial [Alphaproteobacteria bacterium]|nr:SEL1-like repeat protein [Alphaproteobacteria bacterium]